MPRQNWSEFEKQAFNLAMAFTPADSASKPIETTDIAVVFCLIARSLCSTPNGPSRKTTTCRFWWIPGDAIVTAYSNGEQVSVVLF